MILTIPIDIAVSFLTWEGLRPLVFSVQGNEFTATGAGPMLAAAAAGSVVSAVAKLVLATAAARHVLAARTTVPETWAETLSGIKHRVKPLAGAIISFGVAFIAFYFLLLMVAGVAVIVVPLLAVVLLIVASMVFLSRTIFSPIASVVAPPGYAGLRRSIRLSKSYTLAISGRLALAILIGSTMMMLASIFTGPLASGAALDPTADEFIVADILGDDFIAFALSQFVSSLAIGAATVLLGGGLGLLFADLGGPIDESITDVALDRDE